MKRSVGVIMVLAPVVVLVAAIVGWFAYMASDFTQCGINFKTEEAAEAAANNARDRDLDVYVGDPATRIGGPGIEIDNGETGEDARDFLGTVEEIAQAHNGGRPYCRERTHND